MKITIEFHCPELGHQTFIFLHEEWNIGLLTDDLAKVYRHNSELENPVTIDKVTIER